MTIETEAELQMTLDEIRLNCDAIDAIVLEANSKLSHLEKTRCMQLARSIKETALAVNNYFAFLES